MAVATLTVKDALGTNQTLPQRADAAGNEAVIHSLDSSSPHYRAGFSALAPVATPTVFAVLAGSATTTVRVKKVVIYGAATAAGSMPITIEKCSTAGGLGSAVLTTCTAAPLDSGNAAATAVFSTVGTANYTTVPTVVGIVAAGRVNFVALGTAATSGAGIPITVDFTQNSSQALVLRGVAQTLTLSFKGTALVSGGVVDGYVEFEEAPLSAN